MFLLQKMLPVQKKNLDVPMVNVYQTIGNVIMQKTAPTEVTRTSNYVVSFRFDSMKLEYLVTRKW